MARGLFLISTTPASPATFAAVVVVVVVVVGGGGGDCGTVANNDILLLQPLSMVLVLMILSLFLLHVCYRSSHCICSHQTRGLVNCEKM